MTFFVVSLPHTQTTKEFSHCAYTTKVVRFCNMMKSLGHKVVLLASEDNEADCDEFITIITKAEQKQFFGDNDHTKKFFNITWGINEPHWLHRNARAIIEINKRIQPKDFICVIDGASEQIGKAFPNNMTVEFGVGYSGVWSAYRVFESYAWMHCVYGQLAGLKGGEIMNVYGANYDAVIPNYYDVEDFPFSDKKDDYYFFIGRLTESKGYQIAIETCKALGAKLKIAGQGEPPDYGEHVGVVAPKERGELMSKARAVFVPTLYLEPFGGVSVEAMLCGTPIITSDWGAFSENNIQGVTGFRCRTLAEFIKAAKDVDGLNHKVIRDYAVNKFSTKVIAKKYEDYFNKLMTLWEKGWYQE